MNTPVFGFLALSGGAIGGALVRDMALANILYRRGYKVVVYWMYNRLEQLVDPGIRQRMLCLGVPFSAESFQIEADELFKAVGVAAGNGASSDPELVDKLLRLMQKDGVTHLLPTFAFLCPLALAAKNHECHAFDYLVTFQGEEIIANYVNDLQEYYRSLREVVAGSPWPAIAVSQDYLRRIADEMGIDQTRMRAVYPGIEISEKEPAPFNRLASSFPNLTLDAPIVTYMGRQDTEKGIDLLLYAAKLLEQQGDKPQLVISGPACFGTAYREALKQIAAHLRLQIHQGNEVAPEVRDALYAHSRCVVYPSIHREPFGLVVVEAMSHGVPVLVPDKGGPSEIMQAGERRGGLTFRAWDSGDLAGQLHRLLTDQALHDRLSADARLLARNFTLDKMTDDVLAHMGLPAHPSA